jgi:hypothetical protein
MIMLFVLPEDLIHLRDLVQYEEPSPDDSWAGWSVMLAIQVSAEHGDPQHRLLQGWGLLWRVPGMVRTAIQCLPFDGLQQYFTRQIGVDSRQQGRVQMRQLMTANRAVALTNRSRLPNWRASIRQPLFSTRCQDSVVQRRAYQASRSRTSSSEVVGTELSSIHSSGSVPCGGASSIA